MLLSPLLYVASVETLKSHLQKKYLNEIEEIYLGGTQSLFNGNVDLEKAVNENINQYLKNKKLLSWGIKISLTVVSNNGKIIYPMIYDDDEISVQLPNPLQVAEENYIMLSEGFKIHADVEIRHNTLLANFIIFFYSVFFICSYIFYLKYLNKKVFLKDIEKKEQLPRLVAKEKKYVASLKSHERQRNVLSLELTSLKKEFVKQKRKASHNEEEMFNEIVNLEERIKKNDELQHQQKEEMDRLKKEIRFNNANYHLKRTAKGTNTEKKRLNSIYKNINMNDRALSVFCADN